MKKKNFFIDFFKSFAECAVYIKQYCIYQKYDSTRGLFVNKTVSNMKIFRENEKLKFNLNFLWNLFLFPVLAALLNMFITDSDIFNSYRTTEILCFIVVCEVIWCGLFRSILNIVKEREFIKRDNIAGVKVTSYILSRAIVDFFLCAITSAVFTSSFLLISRKYDVEIPNLEISSLGVNLEIYISLLLLMYAADTMGIMISCFCLDEIGASQLSPYILMIELVLSGVLFELSDKMLLMSNVIICRWGTEALCSIFDVGSLPHYGDEMLDFTVSYDHLILIWLVLGTFSILQVLIGNIAMYGTLRKVKI